MIENLPEDLNWNLRDLHLFDTRAREAANG